MRTTIDIPDETYRSLKIKATCEGKTVREMVLEAVEIRLRSASETTKRMHEQRFPVIRSKQPGSLRLGGEGVYEFIPFP